MSKSFCRLCAVAAVFLVLLSSAAVCRADTVTVTIPPDAPEAKAPARDKILAKAFVQAVQQKARAIVGVELPPARQARLDAFLSDRAQSLVQSYSEQSFQTGPDGVQAVYDVTVDRQGLRRLLEQTGVLATARTSQPYTLSMLGRVPGDALAGLELLSGLTRQSGGMGADVPALTIQPITGGYAAELKSGGDDWKAGGESLETVWLRVWGNYFSHEHTAVVASSGTTLVVSGWSAADGAQSFARSLATAPGVGDGSTLEQVTLAPEGVSARFRVRIRDRQALEGFLREATQGRGLTWQIGGE
ncbi:putative lipoprotein [Desulfovibrio sp. X2]|uniref:hypothetical protein n=1 Tax=Desulfovibrio sp. X2 TaxID=941449 RepID=UPI000358B8A4|nr:hypothetical protein [Desulfovibrio sp. X2]EPR44060.1 putative lipoprotein [Desulfovibrio sp. X2]